LALPAALTAHRADAQPGPSTFDPAENVAVLDRAKPDYDPPGILLGSFVVRPKAPLTIQYDDNIYAVSQNIVGDVMTEVAPGVAVRSNWNRHTLGLSANWDETWYAAHSTENSSQWQVGADSRIDVLRNLTVSVVGKAAHLLEPRTDSYDVQTRRPLQYDNDMATVDLAKTFDRIKLTAHYGYESYRYDDNETPEGAPVVEAYRNSGQSTQDGRVDFAIGPALAVFVEGAFQETRYANQLAGYSRDWDGAQVLLGARFQVTRLITGELAVGHFSQWFGDAAYHPVNYPTYRLNLRWFATPLITVALAGAQTSADSGLVNTPSYIARDLQLQADWELRRFIIVSGRAGYENRSYQGISRTDDRYTAAATLKYLFNRVLSANLHYTLIGQGSTGAARGPRFVDNVYGLNLTLQR
jgi:hypothetical protein